MKSRHFCRNCGKVGVPIKEPRGSLWLEITLWVIGVVLFWIPALIYSIWRRHDLHWLCPYCECEDILPADSPRARKLRAKVKAEAGVSSEDEWLKSLD